MSDACFDKADFFFCELRSNFTGSSLVEANLFGADMSNGDFTRCDLRKYVMTDAKILGAKFEYAKMQESIGTNGQPWGFTVKNTSAKKPWWQIWGSRAAM